MKLVAADDNDGAVVTEGEIQAQEEPGQLAYGDEVVTAVGIDIQEAPAQTAYADDGVDHNDNTEDADYIDNQAGGNDAEGDAASDGELFVKE